MPNTTNKEYKQMPFSNEDVCIVSKADPCIMWAGTKILYSGVYGTGALSGYNYYSGEADVEPISASGWGEIRIPELNQLHQIFVFPNNPQLIARGNYTQLDTTVGVSGYPSGVGKCSGKIALLQYMNITSGGYAQSGDSFPWNSGTEVNFCSGVFEIIAFGSQM